MLTVQERRAIYRGEAVLDATHDVRGQKRDRHGRWTLYAGLSDERKASVLQGHPVAVLSGNNAPRTGMAAVRAWAANLFMAQGGKARSPELGEVDLDMRSVRDSMAHGKPNPFKYEAFASVKNVIEKGVVIHSGRYDGTENYYISAPVKIADEDDIVTVLVHRDTKTQRMYLHSVTTKENLLSRRVSGATDSSDSRSSGSSEVGGSVNVAKKQAVGKVSSEDVAAELQRLLMLKGHGNG